MREPPVGTVERWAWDYVLAGSLKAKLSPPPVPEAWEERAPVRRLDAPGRCPELRVVSKADKTRGLAAASGRARALHTFFHHELQAAELMAWAVLAFPEAPREFRTGLVRIALDEIRHMHLYAGQIARLGSGDRGKSSRCETGSGSVSRAAPMRSRSSPRWVSASRARTWSTRRPSRRGFAMRGTRKALAVQGTDRARGDRPRSLRGALVRSVAFPARLRHVASRLAPTAVPHGSRGRPLQREARRRAGQTERFLDELEAWQPDLPGC